MQLRYAVGHGVVLLVYGAGGRFSMKNDDDWPIFHLPCLRVRVVGSALVASRFPNLALCSQPQGQHSFFSTIASDQSIGSERWFRPRYKSSAPCSPDRNALRIFDHLYHNKKYSLSANRFIAPQITCSQLMGFCRRLLRRLSSHDGGGGGDDSAAAVLGASHSRDRRNSGAADTSNQRLMLAQRQFHGHLIDYELIFAQVRRGGRNAAAAAAMGGF